MILRDPNGHEIVTLRDKMAMSVSSECFRQLWTSLSGTEVKNDEIYAATALISYRIADAMLILREKET